VLQLELFLFALLFGFSSPILEPVLYLVSCVLGPNNSIYTCCDSGEIQISGCSQMTLQYTVRLRVLLELMLQDDDLVFGEARPRRNLVAALKSS